MPREESLESGSDRVGDSRDLGNRATVLALTRYSLNIPPNFEQNHVEISLVAAYPFPPPSPCVCSLADDAPTAIGRHRPVSSLEILYRLIKYVGGDADQCFEEIHKWGHGGCWSDVKPEHFELLGIKKMPRQDRRESGRSVAD